MGTETFAPKSNSCLANISPDSPKYKQLSVCADEILTSLLVPRNSADLDTILKALSVPMSPKEGVSLDNSIKLLNNHIITFIIQNTLSSFSKIF